MEKIPKIEQEVATPEELQDFVNRLGVLIPEKLRNVFNPETILKLETQLLLLHNNERNKIYISMRYIRAIRRLIEDSKK